MSDTFRDTFEGKADKWPKDYEEEEPLTEDQVRQLGDNSQADSEILRRIKAYRLDGEDFMLLPRVQGDRGEGDDTSPVQRMMGEHLLQGAFIDHQTGELRGVVDVDTVPGSTEVVGAFLWKRTIIKPPLAKLVFKRPSSDG